MTEPLPQRGPTPLAAVRGPSLLTRKKFGAKPSEWDRFRDLGDDSELGNLNEDDNPFNDPFKYHPFKGMVFPPTDYIGPDDERETDSMLTLLGNNALRLKFVYGYTTRKGSRSNLFYNADGHIVYHTAALGVVYDKKNHEQWFFHGHDDDITALDMNPKDRLTIVTGQLGKDPKILVWTSKPDKHRHLAQLCIIHGDHKRAIIGLSFNASGEFIASMGYDNNRSIAVYQWKGKDKPLEKMRIGFDKGHSDDVYQLCYNPVTDHAVAGGKKFLRFFGLKEGAMANPEADARAAAKSGQAEHKPALSETESKIWAKKGTFGSKLGAQDVMSVAFDDDGITYAGSGDGVIFRFAEQAQDFAVKAHPHSKASYPAAQLCRVTAMWFDKVRGVLYSSGDDGWILAWKPKEWNLQSTPRNGPKPVKEFDLNQWVLSELPGTIVKMDDKELDKDFPNRGSPAAAHSLYGDEQGNLLVGTVCNEIYELSFIENDKTAPMCYMQGHFDELWGLAMHPSKPEYATGAEDGTLRVWSLETSTFVAMAKLEGPVRCCCYSPNGEWIAVGLGGKYCKGPAAKLNGKWVVLETKGLSAVYEPKHTRFERVADIKFSPNSHWIAVANADNGIDVYSVPGYGRGADDKEFRQVAKLEGHSSFINHLDWSSCSTMLQTNCGAHELLYWKLHQGGRLLPKQEKSSSRMRDVEWSTQSCIYGWFVRGVWPEGADGTDINACAKSNTGHQEGRFKTHLLVTSDDFGKVKLFRYPCVVPNADCKPYGGHSSHVTNVGFSADDRWVVSTGGEDRAVFQWEVVRESLNRG